MNDTSALLGQLRIDRKPEPPPGESRRPWLKWLAAALLVASAAAAGLYWQTPDTPQVSVASAVAAGNGAASASVLDASGYVIARRQATVSAKVTGKISEVLIEEGQRVAEGAVLARIDDSNFAAQLALARAQLDAARSQLGELDVQLADAQRTLTRTRELAAKKLVAQQTLDTAQAQVDSLLARRLSAQDAVTVAQRGLDVQQRQSDDTVVRAPFAGVITVKNAQPGEMISPLSAGGAGTRTGIGTLVDMDSLEIEVDVNESFINRVQPGQAVTARLNAYPDWQIPAHVIAVVPTADRSKATVKVRIGMDLRDDRILPEMGVRVSFMTAAPATAETAETAAQTAVRIPALAVRDGRVFVVQGERIESRAVTVGARQGEDVNVTAGLRAGERVVLGRAGAAGDFSGLSDGQQVRIMQ